jgi:hypothetical protein
MYKFKKQYENDSIVYRGRLINKRNLTKEIAEELLRIPSLAFRIEKIDFIEPEKIEIVPVKKTRKKRTTKNSSNE